MTATSVTLANLHANRSARGEAPARTRPVLSRSSCRRVDERRRAGRPHIGRPAAPGGLLRAFRGAFLMEEHFEFRGGDPGRGGEREGFRPRRGGALLP